VRETVSAGLGAAAGETDIRKSKILLERLVIGREVENLLVFKSW